MASYSLIGGGIVPVDNFDTPSTDVLPYPVPPYPAPSTGAGGSGLAGGIADILRALGDATGSILNLPSATPLPPGAGAGSTGGAFAVSSDTIVTVALIIAAAYVISKK